MNVLLGGFLVALAAFLPVAAAQAQQCWVCTVYLDPETGQSWEGCKPGGSASSCTTVCDSTGCTCTASGSCGGFAQVRLELTGGVAHTPSPGIADWLPVGASGDITADERKLLRNVRVEAYARDCAGRIIRRAYSPNQAAAIRRGLSSLAI